MEKKEHHTGQKIEEEKEQEARGGRNLGERRGEDMKGQGNKKKEGGGRGGGGGEKAGVGRGEESESAVLCGLLCVCHLEWYKL